MNSLLSRMISRVRGGVPGLSRAGEAGPGGHSPDELRTGAPGGPRAEFSHSTVLLTAALLFGLFYNVTFWRQLLGVYAPTGGNLTFLASIAVCLFALTALLLMLFDLPYVFKPVLALLFLSAATTAYFMDTYQVMIDHTMLQNAVMTDAKEVLDLLNPRFFVYLGLLGVLPSVLLLRIRIKRKPSFKEAALSRLKLAGVLLASITLSLFPFSKDWASFLREHKAIREYSNPDFPVYSVVKFASSRFSAPKGPLRPIGEDAHVPATDKDRELIILVVGESARADHFSLNGYARETNPLLARSGAISFTNMYSNATSTAISLPLMFAATGQDTHSDRAARASENLLDVLRHAGVNVLWRDNNSDSKGVADRVAYEDFKSGDRNPPVEGEPRDEGMLAGLQEYIDSHGKGDVLIVLHQMGNHGPAYFKRYPSSFERFTPVCRTNELGECSPQEITNAYDNAILYTDYFLSQVVKLLERNSDTFEAAMLYSSDHGESLGEKGLYLHGVPYFLAPEEQKRVATVFWFSDSFRIDTDRFRKARDLKLSHASLFHTILGMMEIQTAVYDPKQDIARLIDPSSPILAEPRPEKPKSHSKP